jgi:hypothetical protein
MKEEAEIARKLRERITALIDNFGNTKEINDLMGAYVELQRWREDNNEVNDDDE